MARVPVRRLRMIAVAAAVGLVASTVPAGLAAAGITHTAVVSDNPADNTPHISDGAVYEYAQVGRTMYVGGRFTRVQSPDRTKSYARSNIMAFNVDTGDVLPFAPRFDNQVWAIEPSADGKGLYIAGRFAKVNGAAARGLVKYDLIANRVDTSFRSMGSTVFDAELVNGRLIVGGQFAKQLAALNPTTGADTGYINVPISGRIVSWAGPTDIQRFAVNPQGTRLVVLGNFTSIGGKARRQAAMINLGPRSASVGSWYSPRWDMRCLESVFPVYTRGVDFSADGSYFVIVTSGGPFVRTQKLCDTASRWATNDNPASQPVWVNHTGGDSLYSVAVTGAAVYVGGHQRWIDNPLGDEHAGPGALARPGIAAIHPVTGKGLAWNPTKTRGVGTKALYPTSEGLWVGSDTERINNEFHARVAFMPL